MNGAETSGTAGAWTTVALPMNGGSTAPAAEPSSTSSPKRRALIRAAPLEAQKFPIVRAVSPGRPFQSDLDVVRDEDGDALLVRRGLSVRVGRVVDQPLRRSAENLRVDANLDR